MVWSDQTIHFRFARATSDFTVDPIPQEEMGYATSLIALARNLGAGIGISIFAAFLSRREQLHQMRLAATIASNPRLFARALSGLENFLNLRGEAPNLAAHCALALIYERILQESSPLSYLDGFRVMAVLLVVAIPFVSIMRKPQFKVPEDGGAE
jgi:hypothetical protein